MIGSFCQEFQSTTGHRTQHILVKDGQYPSSTDDVMVDNSEQYVHLASIRSIIYWTTFSKSNQ